MATKKKSTKKKSTKKKSTKKKSTKKKSSKKKSSKKKSSKKKSSKKKSTKKKSTKKKSTKKKSTKKKSTKKKSTKKKSSKKKLSLAESVFYSDIDQPADPIVSAEGDSIDVIVSPAELRRQLRLRTQELKEQRVSAEKTLSEKILPKIKAGEFGEVNGYYVGFRKKYGRIVSPLRYCIVISVETKLQEKTLRSRQLTCIPKSVDGTLVKVVCMRPEIGERSLGSVDSVVMPKDKFQDADLVDIKDFSQSLSETNLLGGLPVEKAGEDNSGTLGGVFKGKTGKLFGIVNAHFAPEGARFVQPPEMPAELEEWEIGAISDQTEGSVAGDHIDAAVIEVNTSRQISKSVVDLNGETVFFANRRLDNDLDALKRVVKFGAKTRELLNGFIDVPDVGGLNVEGETIGNVIVATSEKDSTFSNSGDSGAFLIAPVKVPDGGIVWLAVGLCFATESNKRTLYACHMKSVIDALDLNIPEDLLLSDWTYE